MNLFKDEKGDLSLTKVFTAAAAGIVALSTIGGSFYTVDSTEKANVRRLGEVVYDKPLDAGLHMKAPFIDTVDRIQVSLTTLHIPPFKVNTVDNQQITLDLNFNFTVPSNQVNHLLYEVGKGGSFDIEGSIIPVVMDRAGRVFNQQNTTSISEKREEIQAAVTSSVFSTVREMFGIEPHTLQFAQVGYSDAFIKSNELAVQAKNEAVKEQNKVAVSQAQAQQQVIAAKAEADAAIETARGKSQSLLLNAQAEKTEKELQGQGQAAKLKSEMAPFGNDPRLYLQFMDAQSKLLWNGQGPQVIATGSGASTNVVVPVPQVNALTPSLK